MDLKLFFRYLPKGFFTVGILDAKFEVTFTKMLLHVSAMEVCFGITFVFTNREFEEVLALDFSVTTYFIPPQVFFLRFFEFL